jgi:hypothetical protein
MTVPLWHDCVKRIASLSYVQHMDEPAPRAAGVRERLGLDTGADGYRPLRLKVTEPTTFVKLCRGDTREVRPDPGEMTRGREVAWARATRPKCMAEVMTDAARKGRVSNGS